MTIATCMQCGEEKWGAVSPCEKCGFSPRTEDDIAWSMCVSDHYLSHETLVQIGEAIKAGKRPRVDPESHAKMLAHMRESGMMQMMGLAPPDKKEGKKGFLARLRDRLGGRSS